MLSRAFYNTFERFHLKYNLLSEKNEQRITVALVSASFDMALALYGFKLQRVTEGNGAFSNLSWNVQRLLFLTLHLKFGYKVRYILSV